MKKLCLLAIICLLFPSLAEARERWTPQQAHDWYAAQGWRVGSNYIPATAINQIEMWQPETFDPKQIDWELGLAEQAGMTTMRVFLHDMLWMADAKAYKARIDTFLEIADKHHIKVLFVLFDSCWDPNPHLGPQPAPIPGQHNSGWVQGPGQKGLEDTAGYPKLEAYVKGVISAYRDDPRIYGWDVWNEPHEGESDSIHQAAKVGLVANLLPQVFAWARAAEPSQPLTSAPYDGGDWSPKGLAALAPVQRIQLEQSDVISFHNYGWPEDFERRIVELEAYARPILCTEYMARGAGSTIDGDLPIAKAHKVSMYNWGFVDGKTQTRFPWDSSQHPYTDREPTVWFHDLFRKDGTPYRQREIDTIRTLTGAP
jgi:hypothetical protein